MSIIPCGHFSLWAFFLVGIFPCGHFSLWAFFLAGIFSVGFFVGFFPVGFFPGILCTMPESSKKLLASTGRVKRCSSQASFLLCDFLRLRFRFAITIIRKSHSVNEEIAYVCDCEFAAKNLNWF